MGRSPHTTDKSWRVSFLDRLNGLFGALQDNVVRAVIAFDGPLDADLLSGAVKQSFLRLPQAACAYDEGWWRARFAAPADANSRAKMVVLTTVMAPESDALADRWLLAPMDPSAGPLVQHALIRIAAPEGARDTLCIKSHHVLMDGEGLRLYVYLLASCYTRLEQGDVPLPAPPQSASRSLRAVLGALPPRALRQSLKPVPWPQSSDPCWSQPLPLTPAGEPVIVKHTLSEGRFRAMRDYGRARGATVNDVLLAAHFRALHRTIRPPAGTRLLLPVYVSLRRHLPPDQQAAICNLAYHSQCDLGTALGETFEDTLASVSAYMQGIKSSPPALGYLTSYALLFTLLPHGVIRRVGEGAIKAALQRRTQYGWVPTLDNMGAIDPARIAFGGVAVRDAYLAICVPEDGSLQLAVSGFRERLTIAIVFRPADANRAFVQQLLSAFVDELPA
jgi:NRPS condensation-like uncharacterized protein